MSNSGKFINSASRYLVNVYFMLPPTFFNNRSNSGITSARCFLLSAFINTEKNDDLMSFYQIDDKIKLKSVQSALSDLKRPPERLQSQCNYRPFIT